MQENLPVERLVRKALRAGEPFGRPGIRQLGIPQGAKRLEEPLIDRPICLALLSSILLLLLSNKNIICQHLKTPLTTGNCLMKCGSVFRRNASSGISPKWLSHVPCFPCDL